MLDSPLYLDTAATTPVSPDVWEAMRPYLTESFGNPSSPHRHGREASVAVERARRTLADLVGVTPGDVVFTSGGTEANNLALVGRGLDVATRQPQRVAVASTEHKSVLAAGQAVAQLGGTCMTLPVDSTGQVLTEELEHALDRRPSVVSVGLVNNETGILADLGPVADACAARRLILHCDAAQAFGKVPIRGAWQMLTLSAHKIGGPKGIGALVVRPGIELSPLLYGGNQQRGLRPGTEPVASIVGFARAAESASQSTDVDAIRSLRELFEQELCQRLGDVVVHGRSVDRAPHITSVAFPGTNSESFLMQLDMRGVAASAGAACTTGSIEPSHVLTAMGVSPELAKSTLRFSFGTHLQVGDVVQAATVVTEVATRLRTMHGASSG